MGDYVGDFSASYGGQSADQDLTITLKSAPVPEASTTVSFGLLLAFGMGGIVIASKRKKAAAKAS